MPSDLPDTPFTPHQLRATGFTRKELDAAVRARVVRRVLHGVYVDADHPDTVQVRLAAAKLVLNKDAVACDRTAAWMHGIDLFAHHEHEVLPPLETYVLRHRQASQRAGCAGGTRDLLECDVMRIDGITVTTPVRTALDLACKLSPRDGLAALDMFMRHHGVTRQELRRLLVRYFRRRGVVQAGRLVAMADPRAESPGESWTRYEMLRHELPPPTPQHWVVIGGVPTYRLDLAYPLHQVVVEYDGQEFHSSPEQRAHDEERRDWLRRNGWIVIVVDQDSFTTEAVEEWISEIRAALRSRHYRRSRG